MERAAQDADRKGSADTGSANGALRLLLVDDDPLNLNIMELMLQPLGYELEYACDGAEALQAIETKPYDLVFMDLMLPDMSGRDVCRKVREREAGKQRVPIVALTGYDMPGQPLELFKAGMDDYIFKPYDLRALRRIINLYAGGNEREADRQTRGGTGPLVESAPVLDTASSVADLSNDVDGYKELLGDFLAGLSARLDRMRRAYEAGDFERLNRECHTLKGISAGLGAMRLSMAATQLGRSCADGQRDSAGSLLEQVERAMTEAQAAGQEFLQG
ncbi:MAG TPA: response regulator [Anaerolineales bacterium]|nr:response regulator [Anaerolineales bacterium]